MTEFATPPPDRSLGKRPSFNYKPFVADLIAHPGEWAVLRDVSSSTAANIKNDLIAPFRPASGRFEATMRFSNGQVKRGDCYVRFIGKGVDTQE